MHFRPLALLFIIGAAFLAACSKKSEPLIPIYYTTATGLDNVEIIANGNPTNRGKALSRFIVSGVNRVQLKADVMEGGYSFRIGKSSSFPPTDYLDVVFREENNSGFRENRLFTFSEGSSWPRWAWQDADEIESFDENDLNEIEAIIENVFEAAKALDLGALRDARPWTNAPDLLASTMEGWGETIQKLKAYDELIHTLSDPSDRIATVGKQMVLIRTKSGERLFYVGRDKASIPEPKAGGPAVWNYYLGTEDMFFAKFEGKWVWLMPVP